MSAKHFGMPDPLMKKVMDHPYPTWEETLPLRFPRGHKGRRETVPWLEKLRANEEHAKGKT